MEIHLPEKISIEEYISKYFFSKFIDIKNEKIIIDFLNLRWIDPFGAVMLTIFIINLTDNNNEVYICCNKNSKCITYLNRMNFFELVGLEIDYPYARRPSNCRFKEMVNITNEDMIEHATSDIINVLSPDNCIKRGYSSYILGELLNNVFHHSRGLGGGYAFAQYYNHTNKTVFAVGDTGRGFLKSLERVLEKELKNTEDKHSYAIFKSMEKGVTGGGEIFDNERASSGDCYNNVGLGLYFLKQICEHNNGKIRIISHNGDVTYEPGCSIIEDHLEDLSNKIIHGSVIAIEINKNFTIPYKEFFSNMNDPHLKNHTDEVQFE